MLFRSDNAVTVPSWQFSSFQTPAVYKNTTLGTISVGSGLASFPAGTVWFYPGEDGRPEKYGAIRFTVPAGREGDYRVKTVVTPVYPSDPQGDTDFHIVLNGKEVFRKFLSPSQSSSSTLTLRLRATQPLDFLIGRGADGSAYGSGLRIQSTLTLIRLRNHGDD